MIKKPRKNKCSECHIIEHKAPIVDIYKLKFIKPKVIDENNTVFSGPIGDWIKELQYQNGWHITKKEPLRISGKNAFSCAEYW